MPIVFFGTPPFAASILSYLIENNVAIVAVVTRPDKPKGRLRTPQPSAVKEVALQHHLPIYQPQKASSEDCAQELKKQGADLFVVVAYGQILRKNILDIPSKGCVNVHASILPKYRGAAPIQRCLIDGCLETGVTIMKMDEGMDTGDILVMEKIDIASFVQAGELSHMLCELAKPLILKIIFDVDKITPVPQDSAEATYAPKIELEDAFISLQRPAKELHNLIRGVNPEPGAWTWVTIRGEKKRFRIQSAQYLDEKGEPGELISFQKNRYGIGCKKGILIPLKVQLEGKKVVSFDDFLRGYPPSHISFIH